MTASGVTEESHTPKVPKRSLEDIQDKYVDWVDENFPKGDKGRGKAGVLLGLLLAEFSKLQDQIVSEVIPAKKVKGAGMPNSTPWGYNQAIDDMRQTYLTIKGGSDG